MWDSIFKYLPDPLGWLCTFLAYLIPYITYKINQNIHKKYDPPWKKEEEKGTAKGKQ